LRVPPAVTRSFPTSDIAGPALIALAALVAVVAIAWLVSSWFQDHYAIPVGGDVERSRTPEPEIEP
jgi:hypothetical protein